MKNPPSLIYSKEYRINDLVSVHVPTIAEIYEYGETDYYNICQLLTAVPYDLMVQLDDIGIDYEDISEYELFLSLFESFLIQGLDISIVLRIDNINELFEGEHTETKDRVILNKDGRVVIDKLIAYDIAEGIRKIHFWKRNESKAGNQEAKEYILQRKRLKLMRAQRKKQPSFLDESIIKMVNTEDFKYDYESVLDLSIYKFNASLHQIPKKRDWDHLMSGAYAGTVDMGKINVEKSHWLSNLTIT